MISTQIEINSPPARVKEVVSHNGTGPASPRSDCDDVLLLQLLDFAKMPEWHSGLGKNTTPITTDTKGSLAIGNKLHCVMEGFTFNSTITNDSTQFQWQGPPVYHVVAGLHTFEFQPSAITPGSTTFVPKEEYSGLLAFMMSPSLAGKKILGQFDKFNTDLKTRVENTSNP